MTPPIRAAVALLCLKNVPFYRAVQRVASAVFLMAATLAVTAPAAEALTFVVTVTSDIDDGGTIATGACQPATDVNCTLREAIRLANENPGTDEIHFNIDPLAIGNTCGIGGPWCTITLTPGVALPTLQTGPDCSNDSVMIYDNDPTDFGTPINGGNFVVHMQPNS